MFSYCIRMKKKLLLFLLFITFFKAHIFAQIDTVKAIADTAATIKGSLHEITVTAYGLDKSLLETPAAINVIGQEQLTEYNNTSILPAVNATPGVRMEERSPGSYRFAIRGSSLESPYGVRNIKVYYNDIPFTEAGGNTYLNQFGFYNFQSLEIIKGPGSSIYGAGTGGVLLINSMEPVWNPGADVNYTGGSYNLSSTEIGVRVGDSTFKNSIRYQHLSCDGYRQQTDTRKDVLSWDAEMKHSSHSELDAHFLYGNLYYQTPGALTLSEYNADPQVARPATATTAGAVASHAAIYQKTILAGFTYKEQFNRQWSNSTTLFGDYSTQLNPNLRNYSRTSEPNFGGRSTFKYETKLNNTTLQWITGAELTQGLTDDRTYNTVNGTPQNLQSDQEINNMQLFGFTQLSCMVSGWQFTGGLSVNKVQVTLGTLSASPYVEQNRTFTDQVAPRIAILRKITADIAVYGTIEKGFSPPSIDELAPTGSQVNLNLNPETGWNYEIGTHAYALDQRLFFDISVFYFRLQNTIVQRTDSSGQDYYLNAGSTIQAGLEAYASYKLLRHNAGFIKDCNVYISYTGNDFHYDKFTQLTNDYSGNQMPGIAPNTIIAGIYADTKPGIYIDVTNFYSDKIALNDANSAYGNAYNDLGARVGYRKKIRKYRMDVYAGVDNLLNQVYSLGDDINAAGGWYYNAAPRINYFAGVSLGYGN
jgi:iron complex outermembrane receptor protein